MSLLKYRGDLSRNRPLTFVTPSIVSDTPAAHAKVKRDLKAILRKAELYLGRKEFDQLVQKHRMARRGRKPKRSFNKLLVAEWDAAVAANPKITRMEFARGIYEVRRYRRYHQYSQQSVRAIEKRLTRALKTREPEQKLKAAVKRPSLLNE
jgi:hypothetical protein